MRKQTCPCGSQQALEHCCAIYHNGKAAPTAQALMRSRYAAYVLGLHDYIYHTWAAETRPKLDEMGGTSLHWMHLHIVSCEEGLEDDAKGEVRFVASYVSSNKGKHLEEHSRFVRQEGRWVYVDGDCHVSDISRNQACPCESGKKFKSCCLKL
ncbi:MAG: YchJ family metal-binding protein [Ghiorsea sp.]